MAVLPQASGVPFLAFDTDLQRVAQGRADGHAVSYGDIADAELLAAVRVERAALVIVTVDDAATALQAVTLLRVAPKEIEQIVQGVRDWGYRPVAEAAPDRAAPPATP